MSHWIVKIKKHGYTGYSHFESPDDPMKLSRPEIISTEHGPCASAEEAWIDWHKKHGNLKGDSSTQKPTT